MSAKTAPARRAPARARRLSPALLAATICLTPAIAAACACGCGIFDVGGAGGAMTDFSAGDFSVFFRYAYMDQNKNWAGSSAANANLNGDKNINTSFYTPGGTWRINPSWSVEAELPIFARHLTTTDDGTVFGPEGSIYTGKLTDVGDLQIVGTYTGLQPNLQTGIMAGLKLPTGNFTGPNGPLGGQEIDRDTLPGTGSTDLILGAYHNGALNTDGTLGYYTQLRAELAFLTTDNYRPGNEFDGAIGIDYSFEDVRPLKRITPVLSLLGSYRQRDSGANSDPANSGYERILIAPGVEFRVANLRLYADIELPLYQRVNAATPGTADSTGQLVASALYKLQLSYDF